MVMMMIILTHVAYGRRAPFIESAAGQEVEKKLYSETIAEMRNYVDVPSYLLVKA